MSKIAEGVVKGSLIASAVNQGMPRKVANEMVRAFSHSIDFRRDLRSGDKFSAYYKTKVAPNGESVGEGELIMATLVNRGTETSIYRYTDSYGNTDFYDEKGRSLRKSLSRYPVQGARISSPFGVRVHPILRYRIMHWGTDFSAPKGTPITAAGDGIIVEHGTKGAYGKYILIRHNSEYKTAYAHMNGYAKGITLGKRVKQGQVIGYVGNTGRSTGPHLHFEIIRNGKRVNPMKVKAAAGGELEGRDLKRFQAERKDIIAKYTKLAASKQKSKIALNAKKSATQN